MHKTLLIFNPNSNHGRSGQIASDLRTLVEVLGGADWRGTEYPGHAAEIASQAADYATVAALGGDGTVHEVANGLMQIEAARRPRLGIVPIGSGNDFATGVAGISETDPAAAMKRVFADTSRAVDVGMIVNGEGRTEYFVNQAGIGIDAAINFQSRKITLIHGFAMYLISTLLVIARNFTAPHMKIAHDGGVLDQPLMLFVVGNGPREGGGFQTTPDAKADDGVFDFVYIHQVSQVRMLQLLPKVIAGTHPREPDVKLGRSTRFVIDADRALPIQVDGEVFAAFEADVRHVEISLLPQALQIAV